MSLSLIQFISTVLLYLLRELLLQRQGSLKESTNNEHIRVHRHIQKRKQALLQQPIKPHPHRQ